MGLPRPLLAGAESIGDEDDSPSESSMERIGGTLASFGSSVWLDTGLADFELDVGTTFKGDVCFLNNKNIEGLNLS